MTVSSSLSEVLEKCNSYTIHHRNKLVIDICKLKHHDAPRILNELFSQVNVSYNLRKDRKFRSYNVKPVHYCAAMLSYLGPKILNLVPPKIKNSETLEIFQKKIKNGSQIDIYVGFPKILS